MSDVLSLPSLMSFTLLKVVTAVCCLTTSVVVKPSFPRRILFIGILPTITLIRPTTGSVLGDYFLACAIVACVLTASDLILLSQPQQEFRWVRQKETSIEHASLGARLRWGARLLCSARGVGWSHEPDIFHPDVPPGTPRLSFVAKKVPATLLWALKVDLSALYIMHSPTITHGVPFAARPWYGKLADMFFWVLAIQSNAEFVHGAISLGSVTLHLSRPEDWSSGWGYWRDAYTLRRFWGRTWHQWLRRFLSAHGKFVARRVLHLEAGTNASAYVQLYTAFFLSGAMHRTGEYIIGLPWSNSGCMRFFMLQALAITVEDGIIAVGRRLGIQEGQRFHVLGYAWVVAWFYCTLAMWFDPMGRQGLWHTFTGTFLPVEWYKSAMSVVGERMYNL